LHIAESNPRAQKTKSPRAVAVGLNNGQDCAHALAVFIQESGKFPERPAPAS
jgi:hypothetical protein